MELGRVDRLYVMSEGEMFWIKRALDHLNGRGDKMARMLIMQSKGRWLVCKCGKPGERFTVDSEDNSMVAHCLKCWKRDVDPTGLFGIDE